MKSLNFCVLGDEEIARQFGKKGTTSDITIYDKKDAGIIRTFTFPSSFPDKIQPLFQALNLAEYVIFHIEKLDKFVGEQIVAIDSLDKTKGIITHSYGIDRNQLKETVKDTSLKDFKIMEKDDLRKEIESIEPFPREGKTRVIIDHFFDVKGVGTVLLGKVDRGVLNVHDTLKLFPQGIEVLVKSIQMHDDPVAEAASPARVGLAVKGVKHDEVQRGDMLSREENIVSEAVLEFKKSPFFKDELSEGQTFVANVGLQMRPAKLVSLNPFKVSFTKPIVFHDICVLLKPES